MIMFVSVVQSRFWLIRSLMVGAAQLAIIIFFAYAIFLGTAHAGVGSEVDRKIAALNIKPRTIELTSEKAIRVRAAIQSGDFSTANRIIAGVVESSRVESWRYHPFDMFIAGIPVAADPQFEENLNTWVAQNKNDAIPYLVRAQYYHDTSWLKRGNNFTTKTEATRLESFVQSMNKASADVDASISLNQGIPYSFYLRLKMLRDLSLSEKMGAAFDEAVTKYPAYYRLYDIRLSALEPKWGGSVSAMYEFVDQFAGRVQEHSPLKLLYLGLYRNLVIAASNSCYRVDRGKSAECVASALQNLIVPGFKERLKGALDLYDHSDHYQFGIVVENIFSDILGINGADLYSGAILQLAATSMHGDTQLEQSDPSRDNYIIDKIVARSWYVKGFYDNALKKNLQALRAVESTEFPSEEAKLLAISGIYENIARAYERLHQYLDMIAYEKVVVATGGKSSSEHLICYGYYQLKDYEDAVRACTDALGHQAANSPARYWRGVAYRDMGQTDAALQDLKAVADLDGSFRASAAIDMSMIYFNRKDNRSALDILNKYQFLYDSNVTNKSNVAVSYNNRCYAYMQLGQLREALEDCRASLKYGSIPDAYRKLQELIDRLGPDKAPI